MLHECGDVDKTAFVTPYGNVYVLNHIISVTLCVVRELSYVAIVSVGHHPYPALSNQELLRMLRSGYRMEKPEGCSEEVYVISVHVLQ